jgi:Fic family protein
MRPFVAREAVWPSHVEGTQATLGELLAAEAGPYVERSPEELRAVGNYVVALQHGIKLLKKLPLSLRLIREVHSKLMQGVRGGHATPGEFRHSQIRSKASLSSARVPTTAREGARLLD